MKSYRVLVIIFFSLLVVYIIAEMNRPRPVDWTITLSKDDKNPYGAYILYNRLKDMFPSASISSKREPAYNLLHDNNARNAAYIILSPVSPSDNTDISELLSFAEKGNYVLLSSSMFSDLVKDTLGLRVNYSGDLFVKDSTRLNFVNPALRTDNGYTFRKLTIDHYFSALEKKDSTTILGITDRRKPDFIKVPVGKGALFLHAAPLCFSNYFMLFNDNATYVSKALSYIPADVTAVYWDEYYKQGRSGPRTPLRFFLGNEWLRWALRLTLIGLVCYALVEMKRRQRIIPVIEPLRNTTLDFVRTVSAVYLGQKDNRSIAHNKIHYWLQFVRQHYYLPTNELNDDFVKTLSKKMNTDEEWLRRLLGVIREIQGSGLVTDAMLLELNRRIEIFYTLSKS